MFDQGSGGTGESQHIHLFEGGAPGCVREGRGDQLGGINLGRIHELTNIASALSNFERTN